MSFKNLINKVKDAASDAAEKVKDVYDDNAPDMVKNVVNKGAELAGDAYDAGKDLAGDVANRVGDDASFFNECRKHREFIEWCFKAKKSLDDMRATEEPNE